MDMLTRAEVAHLRKVVDKLGMTVTSARLEVRADSLLRLLQGSPVRKNTIAVVKANWKKLE